MALLLLNASVSIDPDGVMSVFQFEDIFVNMKKIAAMLLGCSAMMASASHAASTVTFADPAPDKGIGYEWNIRMSHGGKAPTTAEFVRHVGAKSSYEPTFTPPEIGWHHQSDWVALELVENSLVTIEVRNQRGVHYTEVAQDGKKTESTAGQGYFPGFSVYKGWDDTSTEKHSFNSIGNFWSTIQYITAAYDQKGVHGGETKRLATTRLMLPAGKYSINIGGVNALYCLPEQPCFSGRHGYSAKFTAEPIPAGNL